MNLNYQRARLADFAGGLKLSRALAERERWPREQLDRFQQQRFDALVAHARMHSSYYRDWQGQAITKTELMDNFDAIVTDPRLRRDHLLARVESYTGDCLELGRYRVMTTSGSSGRKGLFVYDRPAWTELIAGFLRYNAMIGVAPRIPRLRIAAIGGPSGAHMTRRVAQTVSIGLHRILSLHATQPLSQLVDELNRFQPDFMNVYPSIAVLLADAQMAGQLRISPKVMSTSSELRTPAMTARIEEAFGITPYNLYGSTEGLWGVECDRHDGIHLFEDMVRVEDGGDRLYVTNLFNYAQPLIRFELSDSVTLDRTPCACGRTLVRMRSIEGRTDDVLDLGGVKVHPMQFAPIGHDPEVVEFQVVEQADGLLVLVVARGVAPALEERLKAKVEQGLGALGVADPAVAVERRDALIRQAGGKLQLVVARRGSYAPGDASGGRELQGAHASRA